MRIHKILGSLVVVLTMLSCADHNEQVMMNSIKDSWHKKKIQQFDFKIADPQEPKNIIFVVRNNNEYPYSNLRVIVNFTNRQSKKASIDTLNFTLAEPNGAWKGKGFGDTKETMFQYKLGYKFPAKGDYSIGILQAMRKDTLVGIEDIGIRIEKAKP